MKCGRLHASYRRLGNLGQVYWAKTIMSSTSLRKLVPNLCKEACVLRLLISSKHQRLVSGIQRRSHCAAEQNGNSNGGTRTDANDQGIPLEQQLEALKVQLSEKDKLIADFKDKYIRALAENENVRTRNKRLMDEARLYGIQSFSKDLLEVADVLEKASESVPEEELKKNQHLKDLHEGVMMTGTQLQKVFNKHGLEKVDPVGEKFDPNFHHALFMQPFPGKEPGTVAVVTKIGYKLHDRALRPALVGVVKGD